MWMESGSPQPSRASGPRGGPHEVYALPALKSRGLRLAARLRNGKKTRQLIIAKGHGAAIASAILSMFKETNPIHGAPQECASSNPFLAPAGVAQQLLRR